MPAGSSRSTEPIGRRELLVAVVRGVPAVVALAAIGCEPQTGPPNRRKTKIAGSLPLPPGVFWDQTSQSGHEHSPSCLLKQDGENLRLLVKIGVDQTSDHFLEQLRVVGPGPEFKPVISHTIARRTGRWKHEFEIPRATLPQGARFLIVYATCNRHGSLGVSQAV